MPELVYVAFDFGLKRIGVAIGQALTKKASPLRTLKAKKGEPDWHLIKKIQQVWSPKAFIVGLPTTLSGEELYTTSLAKNFAKELEKRFSIPVYLSDERLSTCEARAYLYEKGGLKEINRAEVDSIAASIILEQWLQARVKE